MKYKTFRALVITVLGLSAGGGYMMWSAHERQRQEELERWLAEEVKKQETERQAALEAAKNAPPAPEVGANTTAPAGAETSGVGQASSPGPATLSATETAVRGAGGEGVLREFDQAILKRIGQPASGDKVKDALKGNPVKVNLYHDDGSGYFNRLKIDLDRDEKWDEKWTMQQGKVLKRQVAPADDENYTQEYRLEGDRWVAGQ